MLKTNSYTQTEFTKKFTSSSKLNYSPFKKHSPQLPQQEIDSPYTKKQPELESEELFFLASLQYLRKKKIAHYYLFSDQIIGHGSFAKVYKGMNIFTNEIVAIKVMEMKHIVQKKLYALLSAEIQIFKSLKHPNVLRCYDILITDNHCYIVTELCTGGQLKQFIEKQSKIHIDDQDLKSYLDPLIYDIYQGLLYLERKNIVHRDIKTSNILVKNGRAKIADFGFATFSKNIFADVMVGSPIYMAPESFLDNIYSSKTDVWAFGILLYELYHGMSPFSHCQNNQELEKQIRIPFKKDKINIYVNEQISQLICQCLIYEHQVRPSFKQLWKNTYIKNLRFKCYVESKDMVSYKKTSSKKIIDSSLSNKDIDKSLNQSYTFNDDSRIENIRSGSTDDENQEGCSFEDFLKIHSTENNQFLIESNLKHHILTSKRIKSQRILEGNCFQEVKGSPKKSLYDQMQEFYSQAQKMMKNQQTLCLTTEDSPKPKKNPQKTQTADKDEWSQQKTEVLNETLKQPIHPQQDTPINLFDEKADKPLQINNQVTQIKTQTTQEKQQPSQFLLNASQEPISPKKSRRIDLNKDFCPQPDSCNEKKKQSQKSHNQNLQKFSNFLNQQQTFKTKISKKQKQITHANQETQQIDQIFVLLEFSRFILKFFKFADKLTCKFQNQQKIDGIMIDNYQNKKTIVCDVIESYSMIFTSYTLNKQIFIRQQFASLCRQFLMKRVSEISLTIDPDQNLELFQIIKSHRAMLQSLKEQKQMLNKGNNEKKLSQIQKLQQTEEQIYKAIKIIQEPITKSGQLTEKKYDSEFCMISRKLCWIGLWLSKIYHIFVQIQNILPSKTKAKCQSSRQNSLRLIKEMQAFVDDYESAKLCLQDQTIELGQGQTIEIKPNKAAEKLLKDDIDYFFQLVYEIQLKRMNLQSQ